MRRRLTRLTKLKPSTTPIPPSRSVPLVNIENATFYRQHPAERPPATETVEQTDWEQHQSDPNPPLFPNLSFSLPSDCRDVVWSVISPSSGSRTTFLQILRGQLLCFPPTARSYPYLSAIKRYPAQAIQYVGFDAEREGHGAKGMRGAYLSARYESRREETDFSLRDFLSGNTDLNPDKQLVQHPDEGLLAATMTNLDLDSLANMPVSQLSNGQTRRARIAKALLSRPQLLLLDGPFMGLDPQTVVAMAQLLRNLALHQSPRLLLSLKPDEHIPSWVSHILLAGQSNYVERSGPKQEVLEFAQEKLRRLVRLKDPSANDLAFIDMARHLNLHNPWAKASRDRQLKVLTSSAEGPRIGSYSHSKDGFAPLDKDVEPPGEIVLAMEGVKVSYGSKTVLGGWQQKDQNSPGLWWSVCRGDRWGVFGPNGSGKTTLLSLITSDHPQTYSLPIKLFGRSRLPEPGKPGISIFELQSRIGHSSPEVHAFFPKNLSVRRTIESAWADTPLSKPRLSHSVDEKVNAALRWFHGELNPSLGPRPWMKDEMVRPALSERSISPDRPQRTSGQKLESVAKVISDDELNPELLSWADELRFRDLSFSAQRVALFIRSIISAPDLVILDEAFSGMDDAARDKCILFLSHGESKLLRYHGGTGKTLRTHSLKVAESDISLLGKVRIPGLSKDQALIMVSHKKEEVPGCVREWICLPKPDGGESVRMGRLSGPLELQYRGWEEIWDVHDFRNEYKPRPKRD